MKYLTPNELKRLTQSALLILWSQILCTLRDLPEGSPERCAALANLDCIRREKFRRAQMRHCLFT